MKNCMIELKAAKKMCENDMLGFAPHVGVASGVVTVGYVGTPLKYNCSVFGEPVNLAARCAWEATKNCVVFPEIMELKKIAEEVFSEESNEEWSLEQKKVDFKNMGEFSVLKAKKQEIIHFISKIEEDGSLGRNIVIHEECENILKELQREGKYRPLKG